MSNTKRPTTVRPELEAIAAQVRSAAQTASGSLELLQLLRLLEALHREIREGSFQAALPDNRQALHNLLRDMETDGGWPYIQRMKLQSLLANLAPDLLPPELQADLKQNLSQDGNPTASP